MRFQEAGLPTGKKTVRESSRPTVFEAVIDAVTDSPIAERARE